MIVRYLNNSCSGLFGFNSRTLRDGEKTRKSGTFSFLGDNRLYIYALLLLSMWSVSAHAINCDTSTPCLNITPLARFEGDEITAHYRIGAGSTTCAELRPVSIENHLLLEDQTVKAGTRRLRSGESPPTVTGGGSYWQECELYRNDSTDVHGSLSGKVTAGNNGSFPAGTQHWIIRVESKGIMIKAGLDAAIDLEVLPYPGSFQGFSEEQELTIKDALLDIAKGIAIYDEYGDYNNSGVLNNVNTTDAYANVRKRLVDELHNLQNITFINKQLSGVCVEWQPYTNNIYLDLTHCNDNGVTVEILVFRALVTKVGSVVGINNATSLSELEIDKIVQSYFTDYYAECVDTINYYRGLAKVPTLLQRYREKESCADDQAYSDSEHPNYVDANGKSGHYATKNGDPNCGILAQNECPGYPSVESITQQTGGCIDQMFKEGPENGDGQKHGHYENMVNSSFSKVACGIYVTPSGSVWAVQNFYH